jgi:putative RNA 2'-phosphotransferase
MEHKDEVKISRFLSKHLRHSPEKIGLTLSQGGWVEVNELLSACSLNKIFITRSELEQIVANNDKQRFSFDDTGTCIRANQGHSVEIDLQLSQQIPPARLYHSTGQDSVQAILKSGLQKMSRHHVHLSLDVKTAIAVGKRHGCPVIFVVNAKAMQQDGFIFYCSDNGIWLVEQVPVKYLTIYSS